MNFILLNLIMAVFFFYYQNFYVQNVKKLRRKKLLCLRLIQEMKKGPSQMIPDTQLKHLVEKYNENPENLLLQEEVQEDDIDAKFAKMKESTREKNKDFDLYYRLRTTL